jgi:DNA-binding transcriptional ArsR family regulator
MDDTENNRICITADLFKTLGHPTRLLMLELLLDRSWCVCELAEKLKINKSVASKHLTLLYDTGLLTMEKKGTKVHYSLVAPCIIEMQKCAYQSIVIEKRRRVL